MPRKAQLPKLEPLPSPIYATWSPRAADSTERWKAYISDDNQSAYFLWVNNPVADQLPHVTELEQVNGNWYTKAETEPKTKAEIWNSDYIYRNDPSPEGAYLKDFLALYEDNPHILGLEKCDPNYVPAVAEFMMNRLGMAHKAPKQPNKPITRYEYQAAPIERHDVERVSTKSQSARFISAGLNIEL